MTPETALLLVKIAHTVVWAFLAGCIVAIPFATHAGRFRLAAVLSGIVLVEIGVLVANRMTCPLTDLAAQLTTYRGDAFDIFLPAWLARNNQRIFGTLFVLAEVHLLLRWGWRRPLAPRERSGGEGGAERI